MKKIYLILIICVLFVGLSCLIVIDGEDEASDGPSGSNDGEGESSEADSTDYEGGEHTGEYGGASVSDYESDAYEAAAKDAATAAAEAENILADFKKSLEETAFRFSEKDKYPGLAGFDVSSKTMNSIFGAMSKSSPQKSSFNIGLGKNTGISFKGGGVSIGVTWQ